MVGRPADRPHRSPIEDQQHLDDGRLVLVPMLLARELHGGLAAVVQQALQARHLPLQVLPVGSGTSRCLPLITVRMGPQVTVHR